MRANAANRRTKPLAKASAPDAERLEVHGQPCRSREVDAPPCRLRSGGKKRADLAPGSAFFLWGVSRPAAADRYDFYIFARVRPSRTYMRGCAHSGIERSSPMLDAVLLAAGLIFFGAMVLYTRACERL